MSGGGPGPEVVVPILLATFAAAVVFAAVVAHGLFLALRPFGAREVRVGFFAVAGLAAAVAATLTIAEAARWMLFPDGQNEEGAFVAAVVAAGFAGAAWFNGRKAPPRRP